MNWTGKRVLVTGAGGFIGSHLTEELIAQGADVTAFVRYNSRNSRGFLGPDVHVYAGDIRDPLFGMDLAPHEIVFHLAACISVPYSFEHPDEVSEVNEGGTRHVLAAARAYQSERVIVVSSSEVYGSAQYVPMDERHPKRPQSPYAASKIAADAMALAFHAVHGLPVTVVRPFNTYGPRQSQRAVIPAIAAQMLWSDKIQVGNLDTKRDFTFATDTVAGLIGAAECPALIGHEVNLGSGETHRIGEILKAMILQHCPKDRPCPRVVCSEERFRTSGAEVTELRSDPRKAEQFMGWKARVSLEHGIARTIEFIRSHPEMYDPERYRI